jgi:hypothetical protein
LGLIRLICFLKNVTKIKTQLVCIDNHNLKW